MEESLLDKGLLGLGGLLDDAIAIGALFFSALAIDTNSSWRAKRVRVP